MDLRMFGRNVAGGFEVAEREHRIFDGPGTVQSPLSVTEGLGVLALQWSFWREFFEELCAE